MSDLLLDFSESTTSDTPPQNGTVQLIDPFDPFGPTSDETNVTDIQQTNGSSDPFDPLAVKSSDNTNPLYDLELNDSNPLYELSKNGRGDSEGDYQELVSPRDDGRDYAELTTKEDYPREVERSEETYTEEDGTVVTVTTITRVDADGNTMTEIMESRMTEEVRSGDEEEVVVVETHEEFVEEDDDNGEPRRMSVSSDEGGEPYGRGVTLDTVYASSRGEEEDRRASISSEGAVTHEDEDRKSESSEEEGEPYGGGVTLESVRNEPETDRPSEYEDGQEFAGSESESHQSAEKGHRILSDFVADQYEEYKPPKRVEKTEPTGKDTGPQYTIMTDEQSGDAEDNGMPSAPTYTRKSSTETKTAPQERPTDIAREHDSSDSDVAGDDKVDDGLDNCPKLGSLKSRFELQKEQEAQQNRAAGGAVERKEPRVRPPRNKPAQEAPVESSSSPVIEEEPEIPRDPNVARETKDKEEVHFAQLASVKSRFEQQAQEAAAAPAPSSRTPRTRKSLTPDENKPAAPVVNREEEQVDDLPPIGTSKSLVAKFKSMETSTPPKPVESRKMTPPREQPREVSEDRESVSSESDRIRAADKKGEVVEEELPPTGTARTLFAKFHSMEDTNAPMPTPERKAKQDRKYRHGYGYQVDLPKTGQTAAPPRESPERLESGEFENTPEVRSDVVREHDFSYEMNPEGGEFENTPEVRDDLVREVDSNIGEELPEEGMAKSLLARFKSLEATASQQKEYKPSGIGNKATPTPLRPTVHSTSRDDVSSTASDGDSVSHSLGGEFESTPQVRTDVLREADNPNEEEELPEEGMARNLLAKFKSIESSSPQLVPLPKTPSRQRSSAKKTASNNSGDADSGIYDSEPAPRTHNEPKVEGGEFENTPEQRADVVREQDYNDEEELPEEGTTKSLLARFKAMQTN